MSEVGPTAVARCMEIRSEGATPRSDVRTSAHFGNPHRALQGPKFATGARSGDTTHFGIGDVTMRRLNRMFTRPESTQTRSICDHRQANRNKGVDTPASQLPRQRASVGSTEAAKDVVARVGRIDRSIERSPGVRRSDRAKHRRASLRASCRRTGAPLGLARI